MRVLSQKLQVRFMCKCGKKFTKVYDDGKINTKEDTTHNIKFVFARCPKCEIIEEINVYCEPK